MEEIAVILTFVVLLFVSLKALGFVLHRVYLSLARRGWVTPSEPALYYLRAARTTVAEVTDGMLVRVRGRVRLIGQEPLLAPFSAEPCCVCITTLEHYRHDPDSDRAYDPRMTEVQSLESVFLEDASGVARVELPRVRSWLKVVMDEKRDRIMEGVPINAFEDFLTANRWSFVAVNEGFPWGQSTLPADFRLRQQLLREGDEVLICGRVHRRPCAGSPALGAAAAGHYRETPLETVIEAPGNKQRTPLLVTSAPKGPTQNKLDK